MKRVAIEGVVDPVDVHTHKRLLDILDPTAKTVDELKKLLK